ncbi:MAG: beta galactosidase jelly roll domain-containing protein [Phycisphaerae bacterium]|nr:beta galactosidase jelly roll domain-containing protein [Phycisphaerae bacterium]
MIYIVFLLLLTGVTASAQDSLNVNDWRVETGSTPTGLTISRRGVKLVENDSLAGLPPKDAKVTSRVEKNSLITSGSVPFGDNDTLTFTRTVSVEGNSAKIVFAYEVSPRTGASKTDKPPRDTILEAKYEVFLAGTSFAGKPYWYSAYDAYVGFAGVGVLGKDPLELWGTELAVKDVGALGAVEFHLSRGEMADTLVRAGGGWRFRYRPNGPMSLWTTCRGSGLGWKGRFECEIATDALFETREYLEYQKEMSEPIGPESFDRYPEFRKRSYLNGLWKTIGFKEAQKDDGLEKGYYKADADPAGWSDAEFPILEDKEGERNRAAWYRKEFDVPEDVAGKRVILTFHKVNGKSRVWLNGKKIGEHENVFFIHRAYMKSVTDESFRFDVTDTILPGKKNTLVVHAVNTQGEYRPGQKEWGGHFGITQPVFYITRPQVYFRNVLMTPDLTNGTMKLECVALNHTGKVASVPIHAKVTPWNDPKVKPYVVNLGTHLISSGETTLQLTLPLRNPVLWETDNPYLYVIELEGRFGKDQQTMYVERTGFRTFSYRGNRFYLNGTPIFLRGYTDGQNSSTCFVDGLRRFLNGRQVVHQYLKIQRELNHNHVRFHTQLWPEVWYDICDELGFLVCNEFVNPKRELANPEEMRGDRINELDLEHMPEMSRVQETITRWVTTQHNHPCSAVWSGGNELHDFRWGKAVSELLTIVHDTIKAADRQNRPVTATSGGEIQRFNPPTKTDYLDNHIYADYPWWSLDRLDPAIDDFRARFRQAYGRDEFPFVDGEFHGIHLRHRVPRPWSLFDERGHISRKGYVQMVGWSRPDWFKQLFTWHLQCVGVRMATKRWTKDGVYEAARMPLEIRRTAGERLAGFEHFCTETVTMYDWYNLRPIPGAEAFRKILSPEFVCVKFPFRKHVFTGGDFEGDVWALNDTRKELSDVKVEAMLVHDGKEYGKEILDIGTMPVGARAIRKYHVKAGADWPAGQWDVRVKMFAGKNLVAENAYRCHVEDAGVYAPIQTTRNVLLHDPAGEASGSGTTAVLKTFGIPYKPFSPDALDKADVLILGKDGLNGAVFENAPKIRKWLENGGRLVMLEQSCDGPIPFLPVLTIEAACPYSYSDPIDETNPALKGLDHQDFFLWNPSSVGTNVFRKLVYPLNEGVVCSGGTSATSKAATFGMTACEYKVGKGLFYLSVLEATDRFREDSVATRYLRNVLDYALTDAWDGSHALEIDGGKLTPILARKDVFFVNLRKHANRAFADEQAGDGKGGWDDNGSRGDMRNLPVGERQLGRVVYDIIDPKTNNNKSCIVLAGTERPNFDKQVTGIPVGKKAKRLFFLQAGCYTTNNGQRIGQYRVRYKDGEVLEVPLVAGENIADWSPYGGVPTKAIAVWKGDSGSFPASLYQFTWENPRPDVEISDIDMASAMRRGMPALVAITGEKQSSGNR